MATTVKLVMIWDKNIAVTSVLVNRRIHLLNRFCMIWNQHDMYKLHSIDGDHKFPQCADILWTSKSLLCSQDEDDFGLDFIDIQTKLINSDLNQIGNMYKYIQVTLKVE